MSYSRYGQNPYQQGGQAENGYGQAYGQPYDQQPQYEMGAYSNTTAAALPTGAPAPPAGPGTLTQQDFLSRVQQIRDQIRDLTNAIEQVGTLHQRALGSAGETAATRELDALVAQTRRNNETIRDRIRELEQDLGRTSDGSRGVKTAQLQAVRATFRGELERYQVVERDYQRRYRDQIARQFRIVNPDASEEEVQQAVQADWGNEGVFQTALRTNRSGQASTVLGAVRARHNELLSIERNITELALLYQEMSALVEQQEPAIVAADENAGRTAEHLEAGNKQVDTGIKHAKNRRKLKWWALLVFVLILCIIALIVGIYKGALGK